MFADFDAGVIRRSLAYLFCEGMAFTLTLTASAAAGGAVLGTALALLRLSGRAVLAGLAELYVTLMRAVPLVLVIFWFYFLWPFVGQWLAGAERPTAISAFWSSLVTFTLFEAAYFCEIMRAGLRSVAPGQGAAARALGLSPWQAMRHVLLPQAVRNMVPLLLTQVIVLFQDTSLVYVVSATDFVGAASKVAHRDGRLVEMYLFVAAVYLVLCSLASAAVRSLRRHGAPA